MDKYYCDHSEGGERQADQKLDLICHGCMKAWIARHDRMLGFLDLLAKTPTFSASAFWYKHLEVKELLKEIRHVKAEDL